MPTQAHRQIAQTVGVNMRLARDARKLTQREVAEAVGATPADVSRWETGRVEPSGKYRMKIAETLFDGDISAMYREPLGAAA